MLAVQGSTHYGKEAVMAGVLGRWSYCMEWERCSAHTLLVVQFGTRAYGMAPFTIKLGLPTSINLIKIDCRRHARRLT